MPLEYNWVGDNEDLAKLRRESRRGEWELVGDKKMDKEPGKDGRSWGEGVDIS